jgi:hypothetical protein
MVAAFGIIAVELLAYPLIRVISSASEGCVFTVPVIILSLVEPHISIPHCAPRRSQNSDRVRRVGNVILDAVVNCSRGGGGIL